ncbi:hypothetical protein JDV02_006161 [Purpureocillium takamizusanense]|uniref:Uncharacterized protein n=1 Tax=Purpureocillium takamizusanense TaxID=2060973 RepID=A0A9Q8VCM5_9HYPO|nr:uncharacterized protein JDV02_006161 [Purpureocillium takamizusanense]UNI20029.1 hypothetical protein JDV02_006161 [Purpureocillium takamizusanense]
MAKQPTYLLAPNFRFKPGTGPIALGNIIADPLRPHRALTTVGADVLKSAYPRIETMADYHRTVSHSTSRDVSMAVWAQFLQTVSAKISGEHGTSVQTSYTMDALETSYFVTDPTLEEIEARIKAPRVQAVIKAGRMPGLRQPVYMVTGLMVAKAFAGQQDRQKHRAGALEVTGDVPTPAGDVGLGTSLSRSLGTEKSDSWVAGEDIVFAYQLLKIELKGWKGTRIEYDELRHKAAFLNKEKDEGDVDEYDEDDQGEVRLQKIAHVESVDDIPHSRDVVTGARLVPTTVTIRKELRGCDAHILCILAVDNV